MKNEIQTMSTDKINARIKEIRREIKWQSPAEQVMQRAELNMLADELRTR